MVPIFPSCLRFSSFLKKFFFFISKLKPRRATIWNNKQPSPAFYQSPSFCLAFACFRSCPLRLGALKRCGPAIYFMAFMGVGGGVQQKLPFSIQTKQRLASQGGVEGWSRQWFFFYFFFTWHKSFGLHLKKSPECAVKMEGGEGGAGLCQILERELK